MLSSQSYKMNISIFTSYTDPEKRMDPWKEALNCYNDFADEVIVVGKHWKQEFSFDYIGKVFQEGFDKSNGDWVIKMDIDTIFHENDFDKIKKALIRYRDYPAISLRKYQIFTPDRYHLKSRMSFILNKKNYPDIKLNGGGDMCDPSLNGVLLDSNNIPTINIPFWNYDSSFKSKDVIAEDRARFARAWHSYFKDYGDRGGNTPELAFKAWFEMIESRYKKHIFKLRIEDHPRYFQPLIKNLSHDMFGYDLFGLKHTTKRNLNDYYNAFKERYYGEYKLMVKNATRNNSTYTHLQ